MNIKEIAAIAKVSTSTVSKVINNKDESISKETRDKVLKIVKEYQYTPYSEVRKNSPHKTNILGVVVSKLYRGANELVDAIEHAASENGYSIMICFTNNTKKDEEKSIKKLIGKNVEGIILLSPEEEKKKIIDYIINEKVQLVLLSGNDDIRSVAQVYCSYEQAGYLATKYLLDIEHKSIGYLTCNNIESKEIEKGYCKALYEKGIIFDSANVYEGKNAVITGEMGTQQFINMNITALICENSEIAYCVYQELNKKGMKIPSDMSVITLENSHIAKLLNPGLTAVQLPYKQVGKASVETLIELIESKDESQEYYKSVDSTLKERASVTQPIKNRRGLGEKILVVGSMNIDIMVNVPYIPTDGETIISTGTALIPGGKGANQAVGAGKLGGLVYAIGRLGSDSDGKEIYNSLVNNSVKVDGIMFDTNSATGKAYINVAGNGQSTIVVYPGANSNFDRRQIRKFQYMFEDAAFCLLSLEIPTDTAEYTIELCAKNDVQVILKPSAVENIKKELLNKITYMVPNEKELNMLVPGVGSIEDKAEFFYSNGVKNVIVTLGEKGCYLKNDKYSLYFPATKFVALDNTGAADAFISALSVFLSEGNDIISAIGFATYSAGLSITRQGVQPAMPDRITLDMYQDEINTLNEMKNREGRKDG